LVSFVFYTAAVAAAVAAAAGAFPVLRFPQTGAKRQSRSDYKYQDDDGVCHD
jgi:hypothetical protein